MTFRNLEYFLAVAEDLSYARAAARLYVSQQTLSEAILRLEAEYGVMLFLRKKPLELTYAGKKFMDYAQHILRLREALENQVATVSRDDEGLVSLAMSSGRGQLWLPSLIKTFKQLYPKSKFNILLGASAYQEKCLINGNVDFIVSYTEKKESGLSTEQLMTDEIYVVVPLSVMKDLFPQDWQDKIKQFGFGCPIAVFESVPFFLSEPDAPIRSVAEKLFKKYHFSPTIGLEASNCGLLLWSALEMGGICLWPGNTLWLHLQKCSNRIQQNLCIFPLHRSSSKLRICAQYYSDHYMSPLSRKFLDFMKDNIPGSSPYPSKDLLAENHQFVPPSH